MKQQNINRKLTFFMGKKLTVLTITFLLTACISSNNYYDPAASYKSETSDGETRVKLIRGIHISEMPGILGAPNRVVDDGINIEKWVYENISSQVYYDPKGDRPALMIILPKSDRNNTRTVTIVFKNNLIYSYFYE